jgi:hypothetical protein
MRAGARSPAGVANEVSAAIAGLETRGEPSEQAGERRDLPARAALGGEAEADGESNRMVRSGGTVPDTRFFVPSGLMSIKRNPASTAALTGVT